MKKINNELLAEMKLSPDSEFKVLIVLEPGVQADSLHLKKYNYLIENMLSAELNLKDIETLSQNDQIASIEPDSEMGIF